MTRSILIAEDENFIANLIKNDLVHRGYDVETAHDGGEAIDYLKDHTPDLVLLDLLMPDTDGFAVLQFLRKSVKKGKKPRVVILSNLNQNLNKKKCEDLGATDYIVKSDIDFDDLFTIVQKHIG